ncbi:MAG: ammonium transporter [Deltaproteobacteria bacterium]|nr:ammonium transporter [Deltaproteobacteria bacterium]
MDTGNTAWMLVSSALVLLMTPGLAFFYGGLTGTKNVLNTIMMSLIAICVVGIVWAIGGYSLAFADGNAIIGGLDYLGLTGVGAEAKSGMSIPHSVFMAFQMMFAIITPALISGAIIGRMKFTAYTVFLVLWSLLVYVPLAHWVWGGGFIAKLGALDFAGGTVVHVSAGFSALVAAIILGRRHGHRVHPHKPHNIPFVALGAALLWFGWYGFNAGSALAADGIAGLAFVNTTLGAFGAMATWAALEMIRNGKPTAVGVATGAVVGLVTITPAAGFVMPMYAILIGIIGATVSFFTIQAMGKTKVDDSLDVFACHGMGGLVGSLLTGVFATKAANAAGADGWLYGNFSLVIKQIIAVVAGIGLAMVMTTVILVVLKLFVYIRVNNEDEQIGLDMSLHGESAYETGYGSGNFGEHAMHESQADSLTAKPLITKKTLSSAES